MESRRCPRCEVTKPLDVFPLNRSQPGGHDLYCRPCRREYQKAYGQKYVINSSTRTGAERGKTSAACELLVRADLLSRGFEVTVPCSPTALHDLHVDIPSVGWVGVQVKAAQVFSPSRRLSVSRGGSRSVKSPILALVFLPDRRIEYRGATGPLPEELLT